MEQETPNTPEELLDYIKTMTNEELLEYYRDKTKERNDYDKTQYALKIFMNSIYGAFANKHFLCYNYDIAASITTQGQSLNKYGSKILNEYFMNKWEDDIETQEKLGVSNPKVISNPIDIYGDTDSCSGDTKINCEDNIKWEIADMFKHYGKILGINLIKNPLTKHNNEIINNTNNQMLHILNYNSTTNEIEKVKIKSIFRHKVKKEKWKLVTKSGKEITVTNDHSMIVFRDGVKLEIKASEIKKTDKILVIQ
jgi:DNA polymerase elongation subunit (family B)